MGKLGVRDNEGDEGNQELRETGRNWITSKIRRLRKRGKFAISKIRGKLELGTSRKMRRVEVKK